jgi:hypothetical protein
MFLELKQIFPKVERLICKICGLWDQFMLNRRAFFKQGKWSALINLGFFWEKWRSFLINAKAIRSIIAKYGVRFVKSWTTSRFSKKQGLVRKTYGLQDQSVANRMTFLQKKKIITRHLNCPRDRFDDQEKQATWHTSPASVLARSPRRKSWYYRYLCF